MVDSVVAAASFAVGDSSVPPAFGLFHGDVAVAAAIAVVVVLRGVVAVDPAAVGIAAGVTGVVAVLAVAVAVAVAVVVVWCGVSVALSEVSVVWCGGTFVLP